MNNSKRAPLLALAGTSLRSRGVQGLVRDLRNFLAFNVLRASTDLTQERYRLSRELARRCAFTVRYGPFTGMKLDSRSWWSGADQGTMILGLYEQEVLGALERVDRRRDILVDVGAADGYYAVGCLIAGIVRHAYCFEISESGQASIRRNAELNGVSERVTVLGEATPGFLSRLHDDFGVERSRIVIIMDIEGAESQLMTPADLPSVAESVLIIEIHDHAIPADFTSDLISGAQKLGMCVAEVATGARNPGEFPELAKWSDDDRWLLCSEGRPQLMRWLVFTPGAEVPGG